MTHLTIAIDDDLLERARSRAHEQGSSIHTMLREYLESFAGKSNVYRQAVRALDEIAARSASGRGGRSWTRDELHER